MLWTGLEWKEWNGQETEEVNGAGSTPPDIFDQLGWLLDRGDQIKSDLETTLCHLENVPLADYLKLLRVLLTLRLCRD